MIFSLIIDRFKDLFLGKYQASLLPGHRHALEAMQHCRRQDDRYMLAGCSDPHCAHQVFIPHSCGHRNCPHCQHHESQQWIENQMDKRLPAPYYLLTFTLPSQLRDLAWRHQREVYTMMFACVQQALKAFVRNDRQLQGAAGFTTVLHTHSRDLNYHPHIHVVMPAAAINTTSGFWRVKDTGFLFAGRALASVFRAKMLAAFNEAQLALPVNMPDKWVAHCKSVGNGDKAIIYLGRYLYRGVIREKDILDVRDGKVTFRYLDAKTETYKTRTVTGEYFLYLLMQHILPRGFHRTRSYGFLHPCCKKLIAFLKIVLQVPAWKRLAEKKERPKLVCPICGAPMLIIATRLPAMAGKTACT